MTCADEVVPGSKSIDLVSFYYGSGVLTSTSSPDSEAPKSAPIAPFSYSSCIPTSPAGHAERINMRASPAGLNQTRSAQGSSAIVPPAATFRASRSSMFSKWFSRHHKHAKGVLGADALPATAVEVQEIEKSSVSRRYTGEDVQPVLPPGKTLALRVAVCYLPHPEKVYYGGEDAYFVSESLNAMGVADGVGGWQESGVNPADYSRLFMKMACAFLEGKEAFARDGVDRSSPLIDPRGALHAAHEHTKVPGSATACVMQLDADNCTLEAANLGDSGFVVIRNGKIVARSKPLQHYFDCPLQFGAFPEFVEATDTADMADTYSIPVAPGDVIVAGSDGLWDNTYDSEITSAAPSTPAELQRSADRIAATARGHAADQEFASPYVREALSQGLDLPWWEKIVGASFKNGRFQLKQLAGGKMDDITVIVGIVDAVDAPQPPLPAALEQNQQPAPAAVADAAAQQGAPTPVVVVPVAATQPAEQPGAVTAPIMPATDSAAATDAAAAAPPAPAQNGPVA